MATIQEAINDLHDEIREREDQIELLNNAERLIAEQGLTEQLYHRICRTLLRYSDMLGKALTEKFPFLSYKNNGINAFVFETDDGMRVEIPSTTAEEVVFVIPNLHTKKSIARTYEFNTFETSALRQQISTANAYLAEKSMIKRARMAYPECFIGFAVMRYVFTNTARRYKRQLTTATESLKRTESRQKRKINAILAEREKQQHQIHLFAPLFLKWTKKVIVCPNSSVSRSLNAYIEVMENNGEVEYIEHESHE